MPIGLYEAALYLAFAHRKALGCDISVLVDKAGKIDAVAQDDRKTPNDAHTASVNLIQTRPGGAKGKIIATTLAPTQACRGMAINSGMKAFVFERMGKRKRIMAPKAGGTWPESEGGFDDEPAVELPRIDGFFAISDAGRSQRAHDWLIGVKSMPMVGSAATNAFIGSAGTMPSRRLVPPVFSVPPTVSQEAAFSDTPANRLLFMALVYAIAGKCFSTFALDRENAPDGSGNNIASLLVGPKNEILAWGRNKGSQHATWHGETALIQSYQARTGGAALVAGSRLYTTLEPCFMCAGVITHAGQGLSIFFGQKDPGISDSSLAKAHNGCCQEHLGTMEALRIARGHMKVPDPNQAPSKKLDEVIAHLGMFYFDQPNGGVTPYLAKEGAKAEFDTAEATYIAMKPKAVDSPEYRVWKAGKDLLDEVT